ncbi:MAG: hypothetical protein ABEJ56_06665 [Candidatus Nanohaloarchaea archaeon]
MSENQDTSKTSQSSQNQDENSKNRPPLFQNRDQSVTGWIDEDRNGDYFLRLRLPLGLGSIPIFLNDAEYEEAQDGFNELVEKRVKQ